MSVLSGIMLFAVAFVVGFIVGRLLYPLSKSINHDTRTIWESKGSVRLPTDTEKNSLVERYVRSLRSVDHTKGQGPFWT